MKILAIGDLHGDKTLAKKLAEKAKKEGIELIIIAGDITLGESSLEDLIGPFAKEKKEILLIPGNHESIETADFLAKKYSPYARNIHGEGIKKGEVGIFGAGTVDWGRNNEQSKEIFRALKKGNEQIKDSKRKIMVTHMHPKGSKAEFTGFEGSKAVKRAIKEFNPNLLISAHIHEAGGIEELIGNTKVINVSRKPKIFEI